MAGWDYNLLGDELEELADFNMSDFGFTMEDNEIDWEDVDDLSEESYEEPKKELLQCPHCNHIDSKTHFMRVDE